VRTTYLALAGLHKSTPVLYGGSVSTPTVDDTAAVGSVDDEVIGHNINSVFGL
jgi:triosephosphate isomerase